MLYCTLPLSNIYSMFTGLTYASRKKRRNVALQLQQIMKPLHHLTVHLNGLNLVLISPNKKT